MHGGFKLNFIHLLCLVTPNSRTEVRFGCNKTQNINELKLK